MNLITRVLLAIGIGLTATTAAVAAPVNCGDSNLGTRFVQVDPAKTGGACYAQEGNFQGNDFSGTGLTGLVLIDKNNNEGIDPGALTYSGGGAVTGTWGFADSLWSAYERLFLAFHFGGGQGSPDSFFVELNARDISGSWSFFNSPGVLDRNGLSNIYLVGIECTLEVDCNCPPTDPNCGDKVPEPGTLFLLGLGALGLALRRRLLA